VLDRLAYLNAGTDGPLPAQAVKAVAAELGRELRDGRTQAHFERRFELNRELRSAYAGVLSCDAADVARARGSPRRSAGWRLSAERRF